MANRSALKANRRRNTVTKCEAGIYVNTFLPELSVKLTSCPHVFPGLADMCSRVLRLATAANTR